MDWTEETVWLYFTAVNGCDSVTKGYELHPSFYGVEENEAYPAMVSIIPNPNNGQMELRLENMEGKVDVKVCNATGVMLDQFEIMTRQGLNTYNYTMQRLSNGVYFFVFSDGKRSVTKKVVIIN